MIEEALVALLLSESAVTDLVGTRVQPMALHETAGVPAIGYECMNENKFFSVQGSTTQLQMDTYQFDCKAATYGEALAIRNAVERRLDGFRGNIVGESINFIQRKDGGRTYGAPNDGSGRGIQSAWIEFDVWHGVDLPVALVS